MSALSLELLNNRSTRENWRLHAEHREIITRIVQSAVSGASSPGLCVLGPGNLNDLDLIRSLETYESISLLDVDSAATYDGVTRQLHSLPKESSSALRKRINL